MPLSRRLLIAVLASTCIACAREPDAHLIAAGSDWSCEPSSPGPHDRCYRDVAACRSDLTSEPRQSITPSHDCTHQASAWCFTADGAAECFRTPAACESFRTLRAEGFWQRFSTSRCAERR